MSGLGLLLAFAVAAFIWWISVKGLAASARSATSAAYARRGLGLYVAGKDQDNAIAAFTESLLLNPKNVAALIGRGGAYLERHDYADAVADLTAAIQLNPDSMQGCLAYFTRATAYLRWGDHEKAIVDATAAIGLSPTFADAYFTRSSAYLKRYGLPPDPRQWPRDAPGVDMIVADLAATDRLVSTDPEVREAAKGILSLIRDIGIAPMQPVALTPEQRAEQQERERQWAAERERLAREQQERERDRAERLAAQRQRQHEEELERQREAQRQWEKRKRQWEERKRKALCWGEERSRATLVVILSVTRWLLRQGDRVFYGVTRHRRDVRVRRVFVSARWWGRKADQALRGWSSRLGTSNEAGMRRCLWLVSAVVLILAFLVGARAIGWVHGRMGHGGSLLSRILDAIPQDASQYEAYMGHLDRKIGLSELLHTDTPYHSARFAPIKAARMSKYSRDRWAILGWFDDYGSISGSLYDNLPLLEKETNPDLGRKRYRRYYTVEIIYSGPSVCDMPWYNWTAVDGPRIVKEGFVGQKVSPP